VCEGEEEVSLLDSFSPLCASRLREVFDEIVLIVDFWGFFSFLAPNPSPSILIGKLSLM